MKRLILVTNDDGINSPGLRAAVEAATEFGDVVCAAPQTQQTAMGGSYPMHPRNGEIKKSVMHVEGIAVPAYGVFGSPAIAVAHAVLSLCKRKPDLCISGINYGENLGLTIFSSGTIGACLEANTYGIPGLAVSMYAPISMHKSEEFSALDWAVAKYFIAKSVRYMLSERLPKRLALLNLNIPEGATTRTKLEMTRQRQPELLGLRASRTEDSLRPVQAEGQQEG